MRRRTTWWRLPLALLALGGAGALVWFNPAIYAKTKTFLNQVTEQVAHGDTPPTPSAAGPRPRAPFRGILTVDEQQRTALGLDVVAVEPQREPISLEVAGQTAYDTASETQVRPKFLSLVKKVYVLTGQHVDKDQELVEIYSSDLAEAKGTYEAKLSQWEHDKRQLARSEQLHNAKPPAISEKDYQDDVNDERKSQREFFIARDDLLFKFGLTGAQIADIKNQSGERRARLTLRAPAAGYIIKRDVVQGNLYDITNVLFIIAPLDKFYVWGNIYPSDANLVQVGQKWHVRCPTLDRALDCTVEVVTPQVDPDTKTIRIRTSIPNLENRVKADMLVSGTLEVAPDPLATVIPRVAMVTADGANYVFIRKPKSPSEFERRRIDIAQEGDRRVIVLRGLEPGESVVAKGSLILAQMYEDASTTSTGTPAE